MRVYHRWVKNKRRGMLNKELAPASAVTSEWLGVTSEWLGVTSAEALTPAWTICYQC